MLYEGLTRHWNPPGAGSAMIDKYFYAWKWRGRLPTYRAALAAGNCRVVVLGDSVTEGYYSSLRWRDGYVPKFRELLQAKWGDRGAGFIDPRQERWTIAPSNGYGLGSVGMFGTNAAWRLNPGTTMSITTPPATSITVIYNEELTAGTFTVTIDGVAHTVDAKKAHYSGRRYTVSDLADTAHAVVVAAPASPSTDYMYFIGLSLDRPGPGVQVHHIGRSGYAPIDLINDAAATEMYRMLIDDWQPHLVILAWGDNEPERSADEYKADVEAFIQRALGVGADVLLLGEPQVSFDLRVRKQYELVNTHTADHVALVDMYRGLGGKGPQNNGYFSGGTPGSVGTDGHPSNAGHLRMAKILYGILQ